MRLRELERDGLICRRTLPTNPPGVVYAMSAAGHGLVTQVEALMNWTPRTLGGHPGRATPLRRSAPADEDDAGG